MKELENRLKKMSVIIKCTTVHIIGVPEEKGVEKVFDYIMAGHFSNLLKNLYSQRVQ